MGIEGLLDRKPRALSGGQRQRVAVGRAIVRQPKVFLFDEPLIEISMQDAGRKCGPKSPNCTSVCRRLIYVTHDQIEAMTMGDRIVVMKTANKVRQTDTPLKLYNEPDNLFVAGFPWQSADEFHQRDTKTGRRVRAFSEIKGRVERVEILIPEGTTGLVREFLDKTVCGLDSAGRYRVGPVPRNADTTVSFPAIVDIVEPMGAETNLYLQTGAHTVVCRSQRRSIIAQTGHRSPVRDECEKGASIRFRVRQSGILSQSDPNFLCFRYLRNFSIALLNSGIIS